MHAGLLRDVLSLLLGFLTGVLSALFGIGGAIVSNKTDLALIEFMSELKGIVGDKPITDEEIKTAKELMIQGLPQRFDSVNAVNNAITSLAVQGLPDDFYQTYAKNVSAVTKEDLLRVAKRYIDLKNLAIVIVGNRAEIEAPLKATNIAPITYIDIEGNPEHPGSRGRNCAKGPATLNQVTDPERIKYPLRRVGKRGEGQWERVSWDEVLDDIAARVRKALQEERRNEIMYHVGRPAMFDGNMFLPDTGTPIWKIERRRTRFAV